MAIIVRPDVSVRDEALALVASGMPQGESSVRLIFERRGRDDAAEGADEGTPIEGADFRSTSGNFSEVNIIVLSFPFQDHGVGGVLWRAAVALAHYVAVRETSYLKRDSEVIELGCGSAALGGLACTLCSGCNSTVTDLPDVLKLARKTIRHNSEVIAASGGKIRSLHLAWGGDLPVQLARKSFDLVLGADVIYRDDLHNAILGTLEALAKSNHSIRAIFSFHSRHPVQEAHFFEELAVAHGFVAEKFDLEGLDELGEWHRRNIQIVQLKRDCH